DHRRPSWRPGEPIALSERRLLAADLQVAWVGIARGVAKRTRCGMLPNFIAFASAEDPKTAQALPFPAGCVDLLRRIHVGHGRDPAARVPRLPRTLTWQARAPPEQCQRRRAPGRPRSVVSAPDSSGSHDKRPHGARAPHRSWARRAPP